MARSAEVLTTSQRVFVLEDTVVLETSNGPQLLIIPLASRNRAETQAADHLANLFSVGLHTEKGDLTGPPPSKLTHLLMADEYLWKKLPRINFYARRPIYDQHFRLCGPGWHAEDTSGPRPVLRIPRRRRHRHRLLKRSHPPTCGRRFKDNAARLPLLVLAFNLANFLRQLLLPKPSEG